MTLNSDLVYKLKYNPTPAPNNPDLDCRLRRVAYDFTLKIMPSRSPLQTMWDAMVSIVVMDRQLATTPMTRGGLTGPRFSATSWAISAERAPIMLVRTPKLPLSSRMQILSRLLLCVWLSDRFESRAKS